MQEENSRQGNEHIWISTVKEVPDGSGDVFVSLPDELLKKLGWTDGTLLNMVASPDTGGIVISAAET